MFAVKACSNIKSVKFKVMFTSNFKRFSSNNLNKFPPDQALEYEKDFKRYTTNELPSSEIISEFYESIFNSLQVKIGNYHPKYECLDHEYIDCDRKAELMKELEEDLNRPDTERILYNAFVESVEEKIGEGEVENVIEAGHLVKHYFSKSKDDDCFEFTKKKNETVRKMYLHFWIDLFGKNWI